MDNLLSYFPLLGDLNLQAGAIVRRYYNTELEIEKKSDDSPVTKADREVEAFLRDSFEQHFPDYSIYGEEYGETKKPGSYRWTIDPIDGTRSFMMRTPLFGTLIALECDGVPILGSIYFPIQDLLLIGSKETGTFLNGEPVRTSKTDKLSDATLIVTDPRVLMSFQQYDSLARLAEQVNIVRGFGDCYGYYLVACGLADIIVEPAGLQYYDIAPMAPIFSGAMGKFSTFDGGLNFTTGQGVATNGILHDQVLHILNSK